MGIEQPGNDTNWRYWWIVKPTLRMIYPQRVIFDEKRGWQLRVEAVAFWLAGYRKVAELLWVAARE